MKIKLYFLREFQNIILLHFTVSNVPRQRTARIKTHFTERKKNIGTKKHKLPTLEKKKRKKKNTDETNRTRAHNRTNHGLRKPKHRPPTALWPPTCCIYPFDVYAMIKISIPAAISISDIISVRKPTGENSKNPSKGRGSRRQKILGGKTGEYPSSSWVFFYRSPPSVGFGNVFGNDTCSTTIVRDDDRARRHRRYSTWVYRRREQLSMVEKNSEDTGAPTGMSAGVEFPSKNSKYANEDVITTHAPMALTRL